MVLFYHDASMYSSSYSVVQLCHAFLTSGDSLGGNRIDSIHHKDIYDH